MADLNETASERSSRRGRASSPPTRATGTIKKRFDSIGIESTEENRRAYRDLLFTTEGAAESISGVILYDETIRQSSSDGTPFPKLLESSGIIPGIKVDKGAKPLAKAQGETITEGLDGLRERLDEYRELGARFAKWRAVISIGDEHPERVLPLDERARARALRGAVPGGRARADRRARGADGRRPHDRAQLRGHRRARCTRVFTELRDQRVEPEDMLLKPNMVLSGYDCSEQAGDDSRSPS